MIHLMFFLLGSGPDIAQVVERQLSMYHYTFPMALNVIYLFYFLVYTDSSSVRVTRLEGFHCAHVPITIPRSSQL